MARLPGVSHRPGLGAGLAALTLLVLGSLLSPVQSGAAQPGTAQAADPDCGPMIMKDRGGPWRCTFSDDFSGLSLDESKWQPVLTYRTGVKTNECRVDSPRNVRVLLGTLRLTARDEGSPFYCDTRVGGYWTQYTGGGVSTRESHNQTYGRFEVRAKFPGATTQGLHSSLWMWPRNREYGRLSGEIDIAEWRSLLPRRAVPFVHYEGNEDDPNRTNWHCYVDNPDQYHTYAVEWTRSRLTFLYDGEVCLVNEWSPDSPLRKPQPFDEPYFLILTQQVGGGLNPPTEDTPFPATMTVDYVRIWQ